MKSWSEGESYFCWGFGPEGLIFRLDRGGRGPVEGRLTTWDPCRVEIWKRKTACKQGDDQDEHGGDYVHVHDGAEGCMKHSRVDIWRRVMMSAGHHR